VKERLLMLMLTVKMNSRTARH